MPLERKDLLDLDDFSSEEIMLLLETTSAMTEVLSRSIRRVPTLRGKTIVNMFYEASTRTRSSFELAAKNLSADLVNVSASQSSVDKGESLVDTVRTLQALGADMIVMRHWEAGAPYLAASWLKCFSNQCRRWLARAPQPSSARSVYGAGTDRLNRRAETRDRGGHTA